MNNIKIIRFKNDVMLPMRGSASAAGLDLYAPHSFRLEPGKQTLVRTGMGFEIPDGWYGQIQGRSSLNKREILAFPGVIDSDYRGEVIVGLMNLGGFPEIVERGNRIAQIIFMPHYIGAFEIISPENITETERGDNGFGSTGR